jgi:hypothetical protein
MDFVLELLKLTIPGALTFFAAYYVLKTYLEHQRQQEQLRHQQEQLRQQQEQKGHSLPLKLQAYERLSMFCERITVPNLLLRVRREGMSAGELRLALLLAIQQEYEHNITQQVYVSAQLWEIIKLAREESVNIVALAAQQVEKTADGKILAQQAMQLTEEQEALIVERALQAIRKEAASRMG